MITSWASRWPWYEAGGTTQSNGNGGEPVQRSHAPLSSLIRVCGTYVKESSAEVIWGITEKERGGRVEQY